jgi:hypothetical protein
MRRPLLITLLFIPIWLSAQYYSTGEDPSGIKWRQIDTEQFQLIFPSTFESKAMRMASVLTKTYAFASTTLNHSPRKISIVLHTGTVKSNGLVAWAPARMELFTVPHQEIYAQDWFEQLAIHEYRHVVQIDKIDSELPGIIKIILGEQAAPLVIGLHLPFWLLEGDAVVTETALSHTGRGRVPSFEMELRAQSVEKGIYSYDKAYLGSYNAYVPDHYQLGYLLVAGVRDQYGADSWGNILQHIAKKPLSFNVLSGEMKSLTGLKLPTLYDTLFTALRKKWLVEDQLLQINPFRNITKPNKNYTSYRYSYEVNDSTYFSVKYSLDDLTKFILIDAKGEEQVIFTPGNLVEESITYGNGQIFWIESKPDIRWAHREYSQLRMLTLKTQKIRNITYSKRIFSPCLSPDGKTLAVINVTEDNRCSIVLISPQTGKIERETQMEGNLFILTPSWSEDSKELLAILLGPKGKTIATINPITGTIATLLPYTFNEAKRPVKRGNLVYYTGTEDGKDDIYAVDVIKKLIYRVTNSRFGVRDAQPTSCKDSILYSNYTANGFNLLKANILPILQDSIHKTLSHHYLLADRLTAQEKGVIEFPTKDTTRYSSHSYSKFNHLFNFHSWAPAHVDMSTQEIRPGFSVISQNKLSTATTQLGYDYSPINKTGKWVAEFGYTGLFPTFKLRGNYGDENSKYFQINTYKNSSNNIVKIDTQQVNFSYTVMNLNGIINIPLQFSQGKWNRLVEPEFQVGYKKLYQETTSPFHDQSTTWLTYRLYAHNLVQTRYRDLQPAMGQIIDLNIFHSPNKSYNQTVLTAEGTLYLPGITRHHGIKIYGGVQDKKGNRNELNDYIFYPRGYANLQNNSLFTLKTDYAFPLVYPDWSLGPLSYIKRISLRLFYDKGWATVPLHAKNGELNLTFESLGGEWVADCNFLRLYVPAKIGARTTFIPGSHTFNLEFLLSINFGAL